jgi:hypothetical protein
MRKRDETSRRLQQTRGFDPLIPHWAPGQQQKQVSGGNLHDRHLAQKVSGVVDPSDAAPSAWWADESDGDDAEAQPPPPLVEDSFNFDATSESSSSSSGNAPSLLVAADYATPSPSVHAPPSTLRNVSVPYLGIGKPPGTSHTVLCLNRDMTPCT